MITREEYECKLGKFVGNVTNHTLHEMFKVINEYQNGLEQHIKTLEAQLNTEQLTCDGCRYDIDKRKYGCYRWSDCSREHTKMIRVDRYQPKDTK